MCMLLYMALFSNLGMILCSFSVLQILYLQNIQSATTRVRIICP